MPTANDAEPDYTGALTTPSCYNGDLPAENLIQQLREAAESPTRTLQQRHLTSSPPPPPSKSRSKSRSPRRRSGHKQSIEHIYRGGEWETASLKHLLRSTGDRLEHEVRRADEAIARAEYAQLQADQTFDRYTAAHQACNDMELRARHAENEVATCRRQLELSEDRVRQLEDRCTDLEGEREEASQRTSTLKKEVRDLQLSVRSHEARDKGWEEGVKIGMMKRLNEERQKLWNAGYAEGSKVARSSAMKEGIRIGRREGLMEGREQGRNEERRNALEAFQVFLNEEMDGTDEWRSEWTRRWTESVYHADSISTVSSRP
ncbi:hypothetical protein CPB85DRAFT_1429254 [Mucidula mucida]|nr:hypothetical protein CPB85DRAFT_1429254 [Mucidula mucida]